MNSLVVLLAVLGLGVIGWFSARARARLLFDGRAQVRATPSYHGIHTALWVILPALVLWVAWSAIVPDLVMSSVMGSPIAERLPASQFEREAILGEAWRLASDPGAGVFNPMARELAGPIS